MPLFFAVPPRRRNLAELDHHNCIHFEPRAPVIRRAGGLAASPNAVAGATVALPCLQVPDGAGPCPCHLRGKRRPWDVVRSSSLPLTRCHLFGLPLRAAAWRTCRQGGGRARGAPRHQAGFGPVVLIGGTGAEEAHINPFRSYPCPTHQMLAGTPRVTRSGPLPAGQRGFRSGSVRVTHGVICLSKCSSSAPGPEVSTSGALSHQVAARCALPPAAVVLVSRMRNCAHRMGEWMRQHRLEQLLFGCVGGRRAGQGAPTPAEHWIAHGRMLHALSATSRAGRRRAHPC
jgi:hypothetical protein